MLPFTTYKMALPMRLLFLARRLVCCQQAGSLRVVNGLRPSHTASRSFCSQDNTQTDVTAFQSKEVQAILKKITGLNLEKVFQPQKKKLKPPKYVLVSDKKLKELTEKARKEAEEQLQMPPVLEERQEITEVLSEDYTLAGLEKSKIVFTDISYGLSERERLIVVREPSGVLRKATWEERDRISQIYFPRPNRQIEPPPLFNDENLEHVLKQERHELLLDAACVQFEPDSADFIRVHKRVYEYIRKNEQYNLLRSTRHFGGMSFYLTRIKSIDGLLCDMMQRNLFDDAVDLIRLYHLLHPNSPSASESKSRGLEGMEMLKVFIELEASSQKGKLELLLQQHQTASETDVVEQ